MANLNESKSIGHSFCIIDMEKSDGCAVTCSNAFDKRAVETKMAIPFLLTWMKEERYFA